MWGMGTFRRIGPAAVLCAAALVGCALDADSPDAGGSSTTPEDHPNEICSEHFTDVRHAEMSDVGMVRQVGPQVIDAPPGPLDPYPDDEPIALCLVPDGDRYAATAIVLSDDTTLVRWTQNLDDAFYWPV